MPPPQPTTPRHHTTASTVPTSPPSTRKPLPATASTVPASPPQRPLISVPPPHHSLHSLSNPFSPSFHRSLTLTGPNRSTAPLSCLSVDVRSPDLTRIQPSIHEKKIRSSEIIADEKKFIVGTYARAPLVLSSGKGCKLYDVEGREYLDLTSGIAVNALGHGDPDWVRAVRQQADVLTHVSNVYYSVPQNPSRPPPRSTVGPSATNHHRSPASIHHHWVLIPLSVVMVLIGVLRYFVSKLMRSDQVPDKKIVKEGQIIIRARNLRAAAKFIPAKSFRARRSYYCKEENGLLHVPKGQAQIPQAQMFSDPNMAIDMMKKNLCWVVR
ncbi:hypothetical protein CASFOL_028708 [Castilleja foliolosa]|uniref:ER membrane protein complex subunit 3 n=1 Tax=Castilleja foliolosa TaxID=1961234 RepID=A0ABD3CBX7_9LAMI